MASPYNNGFVPEPAQRAPSPYNRGYAPDPKQRAPSPYEQGNSNSYYDQHPQTDTANLGHNGQLQYNQAQPPYNGAPAAEGERGLLGALGGGVTGGFIGKQTSHGFLGTVGGALVGSLAEDWTKKRHSRPTTPTQNPSCPPHQGQVYSPPLVGTATTVSTATQVQPGHWQGPAPTYQNPPPKPCGHHHHCGCSFFGKH